MNYKKISINKKELVDFEIPSSPKPFILSITNNNVKFEFLIKNKQRATEVLIMGSGSFDPNKMSLPIFHRHAWINEFEQTVIMYNDPTLYLGELTLGWGNGTKDRHFLNEMSEFLMVLIRKMNYENEKTFLYGSSAGGYMSLMLAGYLKGATAIVNNPQTILENFWPKPVKKMVQVCYPGMTLNEVIIQYPERMNVIKFFKQIEYIPKINYLQNVTATRDIEKHLIPFISGLNELSEKKEIEQIDVQLYSDQKNGHNPVSKEETIKFINSIIN